MTRVDEAIAAMRAETVARMVATPVGRMTDVEDIRPHYVYRIYEGDDLLYIGCTQDVGGRIYMHKQWSVQSPTSWEIARRMTRHTSEEHPTKATAREAERRAIEAEAPLLNIQHNRRRKPA